MGGETENIQRMAEHLSKDLFAIFGWRSVGPFNQNIPCENPEIHKNKSKKNPTHPIDCVFSYPDPYSNNDIYVVVDLKSYSTSTASKISTSAIGKMIRSIARCAECADSSADFMSEYIQTESMYHVYGMLFIYNHEGENTDSLEGVLRGVTADSIPIKDNGKVFVLSPYRVAYLSDVVNDIRIQVLNANITLDSTRWGFYSPDKVLEKRTREGQRSVSAEELMSPWIIMRMYLDDGTHYHLYSDTKGESVDEYIYIIDYIFRAGLIEERMKVTVHQVGTERLAPTLFEKAKSQYIASYFGLEDLSKRVSRIGFESITSRARSFSEIEIGLEARKAAK